MGRSSGPALPGLAVAAAAVLLRWPAGSRPPRSARRWPCRLARPVLPGLVVRQPQAPVLMEEPAAQRRSGLYSLPMAAALVLAALPGRLVAAVAVLALGQPEEMHLRVREEPPAVSAVEQVVAGRLQQQSRQNMERPEALERRPLGWVILSSQHKVAVVAEDQAGG